jgi:hypothetical protein
MCGAFFMAAFKACFEERTEKSPMPCEARRDFLFVAPRKTSWITESNPAPRRRYPNPCIILLEIIPLANINFLL